MKILCLCTNRLRRYTRKKSLNTLSLFTIKNYELFQWFRYSFGKTPISQEHRNTGEMGPILRCGATSGGSKPNVLRSMEGLSPGVRSVFCGDTTIDHDRKVTGYFYQAPLSPRVPLSKMSLFYCET